MSEPKSSFRSWKDLSFMRRMRQQLPVSRDHNSSAANLKSSVDDIQYVADFETAEWTSGSKLTSVLTSSGSGFGPDLTLELSVLEDGVLRFHFDEVSPLKPRYKVKDVVIEDNLIFATEGTAVLRGTRMA